MGPADQRRFGGARQVALVSMNGYHLAQSLIESRGLEPRKGAPDIFDGVGYVALLFRLCERPGAACGADLAWVPGGWNGRSTARRNLIVLAMDNHGLGVICNCCAGKGR